MYGVSTVKADGSMVIWLIVFYNVELVKVQNKALYLCLLQMLPISIAGALGMHVYHVTAFLFHIIIIIIINVQLINVGSKAGM